MSNNTFGIAAAKEHLLSGSEITRLEAIVLYGVPDLTKIISDLRRDGYEVALESVPYAAALRRVNEVAVLTPPADLPVRNVYLTQYRVIR
jgi:Helix-turn-helix domain